jgi:hypothetical protein
VANLTSLFRPRHFPFAAKRFMVGVRFALERNKFMIDIKGLA